MSSHEPALPPEEEDFVRWMNELDLEKVNLLGPEAETDELEEDAKAPSRRLTGEPDAAPLPPKAGDLGWDVE